MEKSVNKKGMGTMPRDTVEKTKGRAEFSTNGTSSTVQRVLPHRGAARGKKGLDGGRGEFVTQAQKGRAVQEISLIQKKKRKRGKKNGKTKNVCGRNRELERTNPERASEGKSQRGYVVQVKRGLRKSTRSRGPRQQERKQWEHCPR